MFILQIYIFYFSACNTRTWVPHSLYATAILIGSYCVDLTKSTLFCVGSTIKLNSLIIIVFVLKVIQNIYNNIVDLLGSLYYLYLFFCNLKITVRCVLIFFINAVYVEMLSFLLNIFTKSFVSTERVVTTKMTLVGEDLTSRYHEWPPPAVRQVAWRRCLPLRHRCPVWARTAGSGEASLCPPTWEVAMERRPCPPCGWAQKTVSCTSTAAPTKCASRKTSSSCSSALRCSASCEYNVFTYYFKNGIDYYHWDILKNMKFGTSIVYNTLIFNA